MFRFLILKVHNSGETFRTFLEFFSCQSQSIFLEIMFNRCINLDAVNYANDLAYEKY